MKVKTITFTIDDRFDAGGIARDLQREHDELLAFTVQGPFEVSQVKFGENEPS